MACQRAETIFSPVNVDRFIDPFLSSKTTSAPPINANTLAKALDVPANRIMAIVKGQRGITGGTAVRLATFFNRTAEFWMNLQKTYERRLAERALSRKVRKHIEHSRAALVSA